MYNLSGSSSVGSRSVISSFSLRSAALFCGSITFALWAGFALYSEPFEHSQVTTGGSTSSNTAHVLTCKWNPGDPVFYILKTKMHINYNGGHWFHMAENFMAEYSQRRSQRTYSNASEIYYVFDEGKLQHNALFSRLTLWVLLFD